MKKTFLFAAAMTILLTESLIFAQDTTLTITNSGNVGIGTTSPQERLHVQKGSAGAFTAGINDIAIFENSGVGYLTILTPDANERGILFGEPSNAAAGGIVYNNSNTPDGLQFRTSGNITRMVIDASGNVGIGVSQPTYGITLPNSVYSSGEGIAHAWTTYSSRRWKTNIKTIDNALKKVEELRGVTYDDKSSGKHSVGLIAEEVGEVIPEIVTYEDRGKDAKSLDYSRLVAVLIEAIKEQQNQIDELKTAVKSMKELR